MSGRICAVIPAAGFGSRLGAAGPKVLVEVAPGVRVLDLLLDAVAPHVDHVNLVLSSEGARLFERERDPRYPLSISIQEQMRGMGDAVICAQPVWRSYDHLVVVWGDQVGVSGQTIAQVVGRQRSATGPQLTLPLVEVERPYVDYQFDATGRLTRVLQAREGDACRAIGSADVGVFAMTVEGLAEAWRDHLNHSPDAIGRRSGEQNFLPLLAYLSSVKRWQLARHEICDERETLGLNTPADLLHMRARRAALTDSLVP